MTVRNILLFFPFICFFTILINVHKTPAVSDPITPPPDMSFSNPCKAVVTYSWNVSGIPNANGVFWELKKDSDFTNLEGPEPGRLIGQGSNNVPTGNVTLDLRDFGQVLNGTMYYFRVVAKNGNQDIARRSNSVRLDVDITPEFTVQLDEQDLSKVNLSLSSLQSDIENCSDSLYYEIKRGSQFANLTGAEANRIDQGTTSINTQDLQFEYPNEREGTQVFFRIVGKFQGSGVDDDVGKRGRGKSVKLKVPVAQIGISGPVPQAPLLAKVRLYTNDDRSPEYALTNEKILVQVIKRGDATQVKAAECSNFDNPSIQWRDYGGSTIPQYFAFSDGGEKEICVQLLNKPNNSTVGAFSNIKRASINIIKLVKHEIPFNAQTLNFLIQNGYNFTGEPNTSSKNPCSQCVTSADDPTQPAPVAIFGFSKGCSCMFKFFTDRATLNDPWEVDQFTISGNQHISVNITRQPRENVIRTTFVTGVLLDRPPLGALFGPTPGLGYNDFKITLIGPEGADWRDAFRQ